MMSGLRHKNDAIYQSANNSFNISRRQSLIRFYSVHLDLNSSTLHPDVLVHRLILCRCSIHNSDQSVRRLTTTPVKSGSKNAHGQYTTSYPSDPNQNLDGTPALLAVSAAATTEGLQRLPKNNGEMALTSTSPTEELKGSPRTMPLDGWGWGQNQS